MSDKFVFPEGTKGLPQDLQSLAGDGYRTVSNAFILMGPENATLRFTGVKGAACLSRVEPLKKAELASDWSNRFTEIYGIV